MGLKKKRFFHIMWDRPFFHQVDPGLEEFPVFLPGVVGRSLPSGDGLLEDIEFA